MEMSTHAIMISFSSMAISLTGDTNTGCSFAVSSCLKLAEMSKEATYLSKGFGDNELLGSAEAEKSKGCV